MVEEVENLKRFCVETFGVAGDIAEVGVYQGGTAKAIRLASNPQKTLYLFDTFDGLKDCGEHDTGMIWNGMFASSLEQVKKVMDGLTNVQFYPGYFPFSVGQELSEKKFSLVHIDVDTHLSTLNSLDFFYNKMSRGGVIIIHDYTNKHTSVKNSVDYFFSNKKELIVTLDGTTQCYIVKK